MRETVRGRFLVQERRRTKSFGFFDAQMRKLCLSGKDESTPETNTHNLTPLAASALATITVRPGNTEGKWSCGITGGSLYQSQAEGPGSNSSSVESLYLILETII